MSSTKDQKLKKVRRLRRKRQIRRRVVGTAEKPRLVVFRSHRNCYCQIIDDERGRTLVAASTVSKGAAPKGAFGGNCAAAAEVGKAIAEKALAAGIGTVQFDRNGYRYHGRIKALAEAAREGGLNL